MDDPFLGFILSAFVSVIAISALFLMVRESPAKWPSAIMVVSGALVAVVLVGTGWSLSTFWDPVQRNFDYLNTFLFRTSILLLVIGGTAGAIVVLLAKAFSEWARKRTTFR